MSTRGFWGIIKNGKTKMIYHPSDSYPEGLGKEVVFIIQNNFECLEKIFEKIIFVNNINNLDRSEAKFMLLGPENLIDENIKEKYFATSAEEALKDNVLEYGYMIDLDKSVLKLYREKTMISEINLTTIKYKDVQKAFAK